MNRKIMNGTVRNGFLRFTRGTHGEVAMEYVVLGVFVVAVVVVAAMVIGITLSQRSNTMSEITVGNTKETVRSDKRFKSEIQPDDIESAEDYLKDIVGNSNQQEMGGKNNNVGIILGD